MILQFVAVVVIVYVLYRAFLWYRTKGIYNIKTGESVRVLSPFSLFRFMFITWWTGKKVFLQQEYLRNQIKDEEMYVSFLGPLMQLTTNNHKLGQLILSDQETYEKNFTQLFTGKTLDRVFGGHQVVAANGEDWKRQRKSMNPAFYSTDMYLSAFIEKATMVLANVEKDTKTTGIIRDISPYMQQMTLDVLGKTIFGHEFNSLEGSLQSDLVAYNYIIDNAISLYTILVGGISERLQTPFIKKLNTYIDVLDTLIYKLIENAKKNLKEGNKKSMLEYLVEANLNGDEDEKLTLKEVRDNIMIFFIAGHETTSASLSFAISMLATHQELQDKLRKEVNENVPGEITIENINKCELLNGVIKETMRKFPPVLVVPARQCTKDTTLGDWVIPKGYRVGISIYNIHHDKEIYGDPENYRPERWLKEEQAKKKIPPTAWLPFSAGPRVCIGNNFSIIEQKVFLVEMVKKFKLEADPKNVVVPEKVFGISGASKMDIKFTLIK
jgi:cytochrome P450